MEQDHLEKFRTCLEQSTLTIPDWYPEEEILRQLHGDDFNYKLSLQNIVDQVKWRESNLPYELADIHVKILNSGVMHIFGRDNFHRSVFVFKPLIAHREGFSNHIEALMTTIGFLTFYHLNHLCHMGKIENNVIIIDLEHALPW